MCHMPYVYTHVNGCGFAFSKATQYVCFVFEHISQRKCCNAHDLPPRTDDARKGWYANHAHANGHEPGHDESWCKQLLAHLPD